MTKEIHIRNKIDDLQQVNLFVEEISNELRLDPELTMNFNLVLEEMVSNVIFYAYPEGTVAPISLTAQTDNGSIIFTLSDEGRAFDPMTRKENDLSINPADRELGGMGIFITKQIMDEVSYQRINGHNILTMKKSIKQ